jgi:hypothetical protein
VAIDGVPRTVSVVVATRNDRPFIRDCVDSLLRQDVPIDELIVLDCGSTDGTAEVVSTVAGVRLVRDVVPDDAVGLSRTLARGDLVVVATGSARYGRSAIRDCLAPAGTGTGGPADGLTPVGTTSLGRAAGAVARWLPITPPAIRCWSTTDRPGFAPDVGRAPRVRCWRYVPSTAAALAAECYRAGSRGQADAGQLRRRRFDPRTALPGLLVAITGLAALRGRGLGRIAVPVAHGVACAVVAARSGTDAGVAPHRALVALELGQWAAGAGFWRGLVATTRSRRS